MSNVILFPKGKKDCPPQTMEELIKNVVETKLGHIDYLVDDITGFIYARVFEDGFDLSEVDARHLLLMVESIKSVMCSSVGVEHPLHDIATEIFEVEDEEVDEAEEATET